MSPSIIVFLKGLTLGLNAGISPGPLTLLVITQTIQHGFKEGTKVAAAPLITDVPIILLSLLLMTKMGNLPLFITSISIAGGLFLTKMAFGLWKIPSLAIKKSEKRPSSFLTGALTNLLNPNPYLFWLTIGSPIILNSEMSITYSATLFALGLFTMMIGIKLLLAYIAKKSLRWLNGPGYSYLLRISSIALIFLALSFFQTAVTHAEGASLSRRFPLIGYGSSDSILSLITVESFYTGFEFGLNETLRRGSTANNLVKNFELTHSPIGAAKSAKALANLGVDLIVGFPGSQDCLLAAKVAKETKVPAIFLNCSHSDLALFGPTIFSTDAPMSFEVEAMIHFLDKQFKNGTGLIVIDPTSAASVNQESFYLKENTRHKMVRLNSNRTLDSKTAEQLKQNQFSFILLTGYPDGMLPLRDQLATINLETPIVGTSAWDNSDSMNRFISNLRSPFFYSSTWNRSSARSLLFINKFKSHFHKDPCPENAFGYDLGLIIGEILSTLPEGTHDPKLLLNVLTRPRCFTDLLAGKLCFSPQGGHSYRTRYFRQLKRTGYKEVFAYGRANPLQP